MTCHFFEKDFLLIAKFFFKKKKEEEMNREVAEFTGEKPKFLK
jgi:hypothetical protein